MPLSTDIGEAKLSPMDYFQAFPRLEEDEGPVLLHGDAHLEVPQKHLFAPK
jgi:hypothetical protein